MTVLAKYVDTVGIRYSYTGTLVTRLEFAPGTVQGPRQPRPTVPQRSAVRDLHQNCTTGTVGGLGAPLILSLNESTRRFLVPQKPLLSMERT